MWKTQRGEQDGREGESVIPMQSSWRVEDDEWTDDEDAFTTFPVEELTHRSVEREGKVYHVYAGLTDGVVTKVVTESVWDGTLRFSRGGYVDSEGRGVLVCELDEEEFGRW